MARTLPHRMTLSIAHRDWTDGAHSISLYGDGTRQVRELAKVIIKPGEAPEINFCALRSVPVNDALKFAEGIITLYTLAQLEEAKQKLDKGV